MNEIVSNISVVPKWHARWPTICSNHCILCKKVTLSKYPANQNSLLYSRLLSFVNRRSACFPNEGVSSIVHCNCPNGIRSPMRLPSVRVDRLSKYIEVTGSGYTLAYHAPYKHSSGVTSTRRTLVENP